MLILRALASFMSFFLLTACGPSIVKESDTAKGQYDYAKALSKDERYEEALKEFLEVRNKHPYSRYATEAELEMANIHYDRESYIEAQGHYETFKSLHPKHEKIDLVTFRIGMSYYHQLPSTVDRDLQLASKAIFHFDQIIQSFPNSEHVPQAKEKRMEIKKMLAEKELYIARFYLKQENFLSALGRFEGLLTNFPENAFDGAVLYGASVSSFKNGSHEKGKKYFQQLLSRFPSSEHSKKARQELKKYVNF